MKRKAQRTLLLVIFMSAVIHGMYASVTDAEVSRALMALKGMEYGMTEQQAVETVKDAAMNSGNARAMNALGLFCMNGMFVDKDTVMGVRMLEAAGVGGYAEAYHNLGVTYKLARYGIVQDLDRAFRYYSAGADSGSVSCMYDAGYMLYKGLGCRQDYGKAAELFSNAVNYDHPNAMYMLGLCYRNGYGVERDEERASYYLNRAGMLGSRYAMEELLRPEPENCLEDIIAVRSTDMEIPENMPVIAPQVNDTSIVKGEYSGYLVMYDWSGRHVIGEKPVAATIMRDGDGLYGEMVLGVDTIPYRATMTAEGKMLFSNTTTSMNERYTPNRRIPYRFDHVQLDIWNESLRGDVSLYNLREKEPERPMYMELQRIGDLEEQRNALYCHVTAAPNPFSVSFDAMFELAGRAEAKVRIFNQLGVMVWSNELGTLEEGKHSVGITPNITDGTYVLNITAGRRVYRTIIVKKRMRKVKRILVLAIVLLNLLPLTKLSAQNYSSETGGTCTGTGIWCRAMNSDADIYTEVNDDPEYEYGDYSEYGEFSQEVVSSDGEHYYYNYGETGSSTESNNVYYDNNSTSASDYWTYNNSNGGYSSGNGTTSGYGDDDVTWQTGLDEIVVTGTSTSKDYFDPPVKHAHDVTIIAYTEDSYYCAYGEEDVLKVPRDAIDCHTVHVLNSIKDSFVITNK